MFVDSPEVAARRATVDARLGPIMQQLARNGAGIDLNTLKVKTYLEYIADKVGDRNEAEMVFLDMVDATLDQAEEVIPRATLLTPGPGIGAR